MELTSSLETQIRDGKVVLLLGAGASMDAKDASGKHPPSGKQLGKMLSDRFLGGKYEDLPLSQISEYSINESDLITVQDYIREIFEPYEPSAAHKIICEYFWWGLATTNYDCLIERAYASVPTSVQTPRPIIENGDRIDEKLRDPKNVLLLKLHGCVTRISNPACPLILTTDQYVEYLKGRDRVFKTLNDWAREKSIVFIGHSLQDPDLRAILLTLTTELNSMRPRYFAIAPDVDEVQKRYWETKRITLLKGCFEEFALTLKEKLSLFGKSIGTIITPSTSSLPITSQFIKTDINLSPTCVQFLQNDVEYVNAVSATEFVSPADFYKGINRGWSAIEQDLDIHRHLGDDILSDHFLVDENGHPGTVELILIKAYAGAGKTNLLRRIAWDAAHDYDSICLYLRSYGVISNAAIQEIIGQTNKRVYLFVDNAASRFRELKSILTNIGPEGKRLTIIVAERINEWNMQCGDIVPFVTSSYELGYLSIKEIDSLLALLEKHKALGTLTDSSLDERRRAFEEIAGRQLLVALHEATLGKSFEEIILSEYENIRPSLAQKIYLSICVLNRLNVPVRAGIISRIHGVPFDEFKQTLFAPLEHVVYAEYDPTIRDYMYQSRHPYIAQIVFERILRNQEEKYEAYIRCLRELNIDYNTDRQAFRQMTRGRTLIDLFSNHELIMSIYEIAKHLAGEDAFLMHQMAIYEMNRSNCNLQTASELLNRAAVLAPSDMSIKHSIAEHRLKSFDVARTPLEREKLLREATEISKSLKASREINAYSYHTLAKIGLKRLKSINITEENTHEVQDIIKDIERNLTDGIQQFPGDPYILDSEAQLASILSDSERVFDCLQKAFDANQRNPFFAIRLARMYIRCEDGGKKLKAQVILKKALESNPGESRLHYAYSKILMETNEATGEQLEYHLKRSFIPGDKNYDAQLLYGRQLFINGNREDSKKIFKQLGAVPMGPETRDKLLYPLEQVFGGEVVKRESVYCFIARDGISDWIYCYKSNIDDKIWASIIQGSRVIYKIAFSFRGANAFDLKIG